MRGLGRASQKIWQEDVQMFESYVPPKARRGKRKMEEALVTIHISEEHLKARKEKMNVILPHGSSKDIEILKSEYPNSDIQIYDVENFPAQMNWATHIMLIGNRFHEKMNMNGNGKIVTAKKVPLTCANIHFGDSSKKVSVLKIPK